jgi:hypothetical protein
MAAAVSALVSGRMLGLPDEVPGRHLDLDGLLTLAATGPAASRQPMLTAAGRAGGFTIAVDGELLDGR